MTIQPFAGKISVALTADLYHAWVVRIFCKALYVFLSLKIIFSWPIWVLLVKYHPLHNPHSIFKSILFLPARWAQIHLDLFCWSSLLFVILSVFIRLNYFSSIIIFWIAVNVYKINFAVANGSDLVLIMLLVFAIPMSYYPTAHKPFWKWLQLLTSNIAAILCQVQIVLIYLVSGWDKLLSEAWRSGEAIQNIAGLDYLFNPNLAATASLNQTINFCLAWIVILVELSFPVLVWFTRTRLFILCIGTIFHVIIWISLSLPDFGLIMIISYFIFLKEKDFSWLKSAFKSLSVKR